MLNAAEFSMGSLLLLTSSTPNSCCGRGAGSAGGARTKLERGGEPALARTLFLDSGRALVGFESSSVEVEAAPESQHDDLELAALQFPAFELPVLELPALEYPALELAAAA
jgi:hypothetical protein